MSKIIDSEFISDLSTHHVALEASTSHVLETIAVIPDTLYFVKPETGWSVAQILTHLCETEKLSLKTLQATGEPTEGRPPDEWVRKLEKALLRRDREYSAPEVTLPKEKNDIEPDLKRFSEYRREMHVIIDQFDLTETCTQSPHPGAGYMTRIEWIYFTVFHGYRHAEQMRLAAEANS